MSARLLGLALLAGLWLGPLPEMASVSMTAAMVLHLALVAVVPALLAPAVPVPAGPALVAAAVAAEGALVWSWHAPGAHAFARLTDVGLVLEQASLVLAGLLLWTVARAAGPLGGATVLLATMMHMTLLGALIGLAPSQVYVACGGGPLGLSPLQDQQLAGALMAGGGAAIYLWAGLARLAPLLADGAGER